MTTENKALLAELNIAKETTDSKSVSDVAAKMQQKETVTLKTRDVKAYVKHMSDKAIAAHEQVSIKERRSYRLAHESKTAADVLFTTYAYFDTEKQCFLSTEKMRELRDLYLSELKAQASFTIQTVYKHFSITGSNRSDTARNSFKQISFECTKAEAEKDLSAVIVKAQAAKKQCVFYNIHDDSKHKCYMFVKV
jgi:hypothetical protein